MTNRTFVLLCLTPLLIFSIVFLALPLMRLFLASGESDIGWSIYLEILRKPRYINTLILTVLVSLATTIAALAVSTTAGMFLSRNQFKGRGILLSIMTLPLAFPGVVIGFLIILLGGRQGLINQLTPGHVLPRQFPRQAHAQGATEAILIKNDFLHQTTQFRLLGRNLLCLRSKIGPQTVIIDLMIHAEAIDLRARTLFTHLLCSWREGFSKIGLCLPRRSLSDQTIR